MTVPDDQVVELKHLCSEVLACDEGETSYILLRGLLLPDGCNPQQTDALLCPSQRDGYDSRLFFADKITFHRPPNWTGVAHIVGRTWHVYSWRIPPNLRLAQMVAMHLKAFR